MVKFHGQLVQSVDDLLVILNDAIICKALNFDTKNSEVYRIEITFIITIYIIWIYKYLKSFCLNLNSYFFLNFKVKFQYWKQY